MSAEKPPILHIGYGKTATTWFQQKFYPKIQNIDFYDHRRIVATLGGEWSHIDIRKIHINQITKSNKKLVICDESMIGKKDNLSDRISLLKTLFYPARIIIFIRNQYNKIPSGYSRYIKMGGTARFHEYFMDEGMQDFLDKHKYEQFIAQYISHFGASNVFVYLYEEFKSDPKNFISIFCREQQLEYPTNLAFTEIQNRALSTTLIKIKRLSNYLTKKYPSGIVNRRSKKFIFHIPFWFGISYSIFNFLNRLNFSNREEFHLSAKEKKIVEDYFAESNRSLMDKHNLYKMKEYYYPGCN